MSAAAPLSAQPTPCRFFLKGKCTKGSSCPYTHPANDKEIPCRFFAQGKCASGETCRFAHVKKTDIECAFFKQGKCDRSNCEFKHVKAEGK